MDQRLNNRAEGSARPEGGREAPALGGGSGAARCRAPGGTGRWSSLSVPMLIGYFSTTLVIGSFVWFSRAEICRDVSNSNVECGTRWELLLSAPFNEIGDTLAGFAGALAFIWLIVTVLIQGLELAAQREELRATRLEAAKTAKALDAQVEILMNEQRQRLQAQTDQRVQEWMRCIVFEANQVGLKSIEYVLPEPRGGIVQSLTMFKRTAEDDAITSRMMQLAVSSSGNFATLQHVEKRGMRIKNKPAAEEYAFLREALGAVARLDENMSEVQKLELRRMRFEGTRANVEHFVKLLGYS